MKYFYRTDATVFVHFMIYVHKKAFAAMTNTDSILI